MNELKNLVGRKVFILLDNTEGVEGILKDVGTTYFYLDNCKIYGTEFQEIYILKMHVIRISVRHHE